jgi:hypothetical protein
MPSQRLRARIETGSLGTVYTTADPHHMPRRELPAVDATDLVLRFHIKRCRGGFRPPLSTDRSRAGVRLRDLRAIAAADCGPTSSEADFDGEVGGPAATTCSTPGFCHARRYHLLHEQIDTQHWQGLDAIRCEAAEAARQGEHSDAGRGTETRAHAQRCSVEGKLTQSLNEAD